MYKLELFKGSISKRPSLNCKSPYVADAFIYDDDSSCMVHTPALGCCGLCDKDAIVYLSKMKNTKNVCSYRCLLYTSPSPRDLYRSRMPSSA